MSEGERKNLKVSEETHTKLLRIQGYIQSKTGENVDADQAVSMACESFLTLNDNDVPQPDWE